MSKRVTILLHLAIWGILFLSPLTFLRNRGVDPVQYVMLSMSPLLMMIVFYVNYLWLTPRYFVTGKQRYYWLTNIVMLVCLGVFLHFWMTFAHSYFETGHPRHLHAPTVVDTLLMILRDIFNLAVAAAIATTIQLAMRWHKSEDARLEAEAARAEAELRNLRSQVNPHFLLNTLNNIYALTAFDTQRAQDAIQQLSRLLRHMLYDNQQELVALSDEIQFLENYVNLMKIRLADSVDVRFEKHVAKPDIHIAPLLFISLVENAFKHGVSPTEPSFIHIAITAADALTFSIENTNHPKPQHDRSGHGIGLQQVQRRLDLAYPQRYTWQKGVSPDGRVYSSRITLYVNPQS